jgi:hypothetical protein
VFQTKGIRRQIEVLIADETKLSNGDRVMLDSSTSRIIGRRDPYIATIEKRMVRSPGAPTLSAMDHGLSRPFNSRRAASPALQTSPGPM